MVNDTLKFNENNFGQMAAYVMQDDILFEYFTPKEALMFSADLKIAHLSQEERENRVNQLIETLGLKAVQDTIIGSVL